MLTLFDNPIVQSAVLPFIIALAAGLLVAFIAPRWFGMVLPLSFYPPAFLISGLQLLPLTSTRKILLLGLVAVVIVVASLRLPLAMRRYGLIVIMAVVSVAWVLWPRLVVGETFAWLPLLVGAAYLYWLFIITDRQQQPTSQLLTLLTMATTVAVLSMLGSSALLGQLSGVLAATMGALLLAMLLTGRLSDTDLLILPAVLIVGLISLAAVHYATLKWYSLVAVALVPLVPYLPINIHNRWLRLIIQLIIMMPLVAGAIYLVLDTSGESYY
jgi:hypothetical protein